jgi:tetratricopeptide (TPR) repeat protein
LDQLRRQILQHTAELTGLSFLSPAFVEAHAKLSSSIAMEEFLLQCASSLKACWHLLHSKGLPLASQILATYLPTLMTLAFRSSSYQGTAASLATEAKILQAVLAMHRVDLTGRERHCLEAIRCGRLSSDTGLLAAALMYLGYTYTYCLPRPEKAVSCYQEALQALGSEMSLLRSDISIGLADTYAKMGEEQKALEAIALAQTHFPVHPEQDPRVRYADCRWAELYQWEGKTYLDLAQHYPERGYYKQAHEAFTRSAAWQPVGDLSTSETLLNHAEAARGLDDLEYYVACLREGALKGLLAGSQKRYSEAYAIFRSTPAKWLQEKPIRALAAEVFHQ